MTTTLTEAPQLDEKGRERIGDSLWYFHEATGERFISVTSITDGLGSEMLGEFWRPEQAALAAINNAPKIVRATMLHPCGKTPTGWRRTPQCQSGTDGHDPRVRCSECPCGECGPCVMVWLRDEHFRRSAEARGRGSEVHHWIERWILSGGTEPALDDIAEPYQPYIRGFLLFVKDYGLTPASWEMAEARVINRTHGWGGTLDGAIRFDATATPKARELCEKFGMLRPLLVNDWQTREKDEPRFEGSKGLQVAVYRRAEYLLLRGGQEEPMPVTDGGIVVQLHQDDYDLRPVVTGDDDDYVRGFLHRLQNKLWTLQRLPVLASVWHYERDQYGRIRVGEDGKQVRVTTFPRREIPGLEPEPKPAKKAAPRAATKAAPRKAAGTPAGEAGTAPARKATKRAPAKKTVAAKAQPTQPALPEPQGPSKLERVTLTGAAARGFAAHSGRPVDPRSPYGDDIPF